ncbi:MAG: Fur family zinc uptake transcriptional regulator [Alphaproteobacteria bacterium]|jgi:Fur family zinc uptake transcriptional regulator
MASPQNEPTPPVESEAFMASPHDHQSCIDDAVAGAVRLCAKKALRLTQIRRRVLELVWSQHRPIGAYDILEGLRPDYPRAAPPTVYRALDFLNDLGLIHRIESMNAFVGCTNPDEPHSGQFLICGDCGATAELDDPEIEAAVRRGAARLGFDAIRQTVEITGQCPDCQTAQPEHS